LDFNRKAVAEGFDIASPCGPPAQVRAGTRRAFLLHPIRFFDRSKADAAKTLSARLSAPLALAASKHFEGHEPGRRAVPKSTDFTSIGQTSQGIAEFLYSAYVIDGAMVTEILWMEAASSSTV
jgi:hypothetical protein